MRTILSALLLCLVVVAPTFAADKAPSDESIRRLMTAMEQKKLMDTVLATVDSSMDAAMKKALAGKPIDEKTQAVVDETRARITAVFKETLNWDDLQPLMIEVYRRSFTQSEVDGMLKFYESDAGKAVVRKFPLVQQNTMQLMQTRMAAMVPRIAQIQQEAVAKIQAAQSP